VSSLPTLGPRGEGWVAIQGILLVAVLAAGFVGQVDAGPASPLVMALGLVLMAVGGVLALRGLLDLRGALTALPHPRVGASLVETGVYALVRHPIYGGIVIGSAGYALLLRSPLALAGAFVLLGFFRLKSAREEAWLVDHYEGYAAYRARTRRMLPYLY
jgi:protein-S-isoprenylcysteine O-methyltransferase Ste14